MDEREELKQELQLELQWVQYRQRMLDIIEEKLFQMKQLAQPKEENLNPVELKALNEKLNDLVEQIMTIDSESRKMEDGKILE